ncbi:MAG: MBL fold metallo-hydrolase [Deltaproteobacteria bacterium]|nr:MBL fold metallo-hydrolase [Deltaproteobacteria bacterium]
MWIREPGPVTEHVEMIGNMAFPCYVIHGRKVALVDAGVTAIAPLLEERFGPGHIELDTVLLTHSHYDHVGGLGVLRRLHPALEVVASPSARQALSREKVYRFILDMNRRDEKTYGFAHAFGGRVVPLDASDLRVDRVLEDGESLDLGDGVRVTGYASPGHTRCSMVFLVEPDRLLVGGESLGGYVSPDEIQAQSASSFRDYLDSLRRIGELDFDAIALPHHGVLTGEDVESYIAVAIRTAESFRDEVIARIDAGASQEKVAADLARKLRHGLSELQPMRAFQINLAAMIRVLLKEREQDGEPRPR